jgi:hypothetical protein
MRNLIVETRLNMTAGVMSVAGKIFFYKVIVVVILISKDNSDWYKKTATWVGARKVNRPMKSKEEKGEIMVFLNEFIIIGCLLYVHVCVNWMKLAWKEWGNS